jgi:para-nitrobenzyl esterase
MSEPLLRTRYGTLRGTVEDGLAVFRGVPYAASTTGSGRFRPPRPPAEWQGVRDATTFGFVSPQPPPTAMDAIPGDPSEQSEDSLVLNVWTPGLDEAKRPVMVFIHGGGFTTGSSSVSVYHGPALARRGVVLVTFNYRLGILGWLAHPALAEGDDFAGFGNWGLRDQLAALGFVREHALALGGDPDNITIFGESAGAMSVAALVSSAEARPLFRRAIMQSGAAAALGPGTALAVADDVADSLGLDSLARAELEALPADSFLQAQSQIMAAYGIAGLPLQPVVDGGLLRRHPAAEIAAGAAGGVDLMIGTNRDEWKFFTFSAAAVSEIDEERLLALVRRHVKGAGLLEDISPQESIDLYRAERLARGQSVDPADLYTAMATDWVFRVPSMRTAAAQSEHNSATFAYLFDWESPFGGGALGSCHALELPFVFGTVDNPMVALFTGTGPDVTDLSEAMQAAWVAFATNGDPSVTSDPGGAWLPYSSASRSTKRFGPRRELLEAPMEREREHLDRGFGPYGQAEEARLARPLPKAAGATSGT